MKKTLLSLILSAIAICIMAAPVSQQTTLRLATFFFHEHGGNGNLTLVEIPQYPHLHFYSAADGNGFVIIAADDIVFPILGYSTTSPISATDIPINAAEWFSECENQIKWHIENGHEQSSEVAEEWQNLNSMVPTRLKPMATQTSHTFNTANLITTIWAQSPYYNEQCPYDTTEQKRTKTGCVATAMAQIMKYWGHPLRGVGSYSYNDPPYGTQSANFADTVFNYAMMPDSLTSNSSQAEIDAVALLMHRCGIAVEMEYGTSSSSSSTIGFNSYRSAESAYSEHFKYLHTVHAIDIEDYTDSAWVATLKNEIDNGRPMQYSAGNVLTGGGHSFICSGYDNTDKFYFNWGWSGRYNGYFAIGQLNPSSRYQYNARNRVIIGIQPDTTEAATTTVTLNTNIPGAATLTGAGTYNSYTDWVTIKAMANPGYLFCNWDGSITYNPFRFLANGGNVTHTANCIPMEGDTLGYCFDSYTTAFGSSASERTYRWGIRLDSFSIAQHRQIEAIKTYVSETGQYKLGIYNGTATEPTGEALADSTYDAENEDVWETFTLPEPIAVDRTKSLWIILEWTGTGYPMSCSDFRGNPDGSWCDTGEHEWVKYTDNGTYLSWMIRGIFGNNPGPYAITVSPDDETHGTTTGSGTYPADTVITITATPKTGYLFKQWNDGDTAASRSITVTDVATYTAYFDEDPKAAVENNVLDAITAYGNGNQLVIENATGENIGVYDATGRLILTRTLSTSYETITLPTGIYFVHIVNQTFKTVIK